MRYLVLTYSVVLMALVFSLTGCAHHRELAKEPCGKTNFIRQIQRAEGVLAENCPIWE